MQLTRECDRQTDRHTHRQTHDDGIYRAIKSTQPFHVAACMQRGRCDFEAA